VNGRFLDGLDVKKLRTWVVLGVVAAVVLLIVSTFFSAAPNAAPASAKSAGVQSSAPGQDIMSYEQVLAGSLQTALGRVKGAGEVEVTLSLQGGPGYLYAFNQTTHRQTTTGGTGTPSGQTVDDQTQTTLATAGTAQTPVLQQETSPKVTGALIVATGASDPTVREELTQAAESLLGLPAYAIEVLPAGGGR